MQRYLSRFTWPQAAVLLLLVLVLRHKLAMWSQLPVGWMLVVAILSAKYAAEWPQTRKRFRDVRRNGGGWGARLVALLPSVLPAAVKFEKSLWTGFFQCLLRRPPVRSPMAGKPLHYLGGNYGLVLIFAILACVADMPMSSLIASSLVPDPARKFIIHASLLGITFFSMVWVIGDRWLVRAGNHVLGDRYLHLRIGSRFHADIPRESIVNAERVDVPERVWCLRNGRSAADIVTATPLDRANVVLTIDEESAPQLEYFKFIRKAPRYLMLYVDEPQILINEFSQKTAA
ncbi:hypothetical protein [Undibacterium sp.]|uniref:hypothetical protein n=1 Tax=Undibacterium sp. TaxID=1914977 RepID=UPI002CBDACEE|nr:hypothetical protein [Undibacterium sp.]HTD03855.1 hypothetical protein [Undibacterium sp.]